MVHNFAEGGGGKVEPGRMFENMYCGRASTSKKAQRGVGRTKGLEWLKVELKWGKMETKLFTRGKEEWEMGKRLF